MTTKLAVLRRVKHTAKFVILDGEILDVLYEAFHHDFSLTSHRARFIPGAGTFPLL